MIVSQEDFLQELVKSAKKGKTRVDFCRMMEKRYGITYAGVSGRYDKLMKRLEEQEKVAKTSTKGLLRSVIAGVTLKKKEKEKKKESDIQLLARLIKAKN